MMKKSLLLLAFAACAAGTTATAQMLTINEVYPGGGSNTAGATYTRDFVELYNNSSTAFSLTGFTLQYSAAGATSDFTGVIVAFGAGSVIGANDYLSIFTGATGTAGTALTAGSGAGFVTYVAPSNSASLSASNGSVRLFNTNTSTVVDLVGYGTVTTNTTSGNVKSEGTAATAPSSTAMSIGRTGFVDTNNNSADFTSMTPSPNAGTTSTVVAAPEPSTWAILGGGIGLLAVVFRRRTLA